MFENNRVWRTTDSVSANTLSLHILPGSLKPSFSAGFSMIRIHVLPCQSTGDRLEIWERMWEIWWRGKALRYRCEGSNAPRAARQWRRPVSCNSAWRRQELDVPGPEEWQQARLRLGQRVQSLAGDSHSPGPTPSRRSLPAWQRKSSRSVSPASTGR